jgi:LmbE family N-acetylglucosaminyl deacetylase
VNAAEVLGVSQDKIIFCRYRDRSVPSRGSEGFADAVQNISSVMRLIQPQSIFVPWRRDPHPDHKAAFQLVQDAEKNEAKVYEYPIWLTELGESGDLPLENEAVPFRLNIESVLDKKMAAVSKHQSQITGLIHDDPEGFQLSESMISQFSVPFETFFISKL